MRRGDWLVCLDSREARGGRRSSASASYYKRGARARGRRVEVSRKRRAAGGNGRRICGGIWLMTTHAYPRKCSRLPAEKRSPVGPSLSWTGERAVPVSGQAWRCAARVHPDLSGEDGVPIIRGAICSKWLFLTNFYSIRNGSLENFQSNFISPKSVTYWRFLQPKLSRFLRNKPYQKAFLFLRF